VCASVWSRHCLARVAPRGCQSGAAGDALLGVGRRLPDGWVTPRTVCFQGGESVTCGRRPTVAHFKPSAGTAEITDECMA